MTHLKRKDVKDAVDLLMRGYEEEMNLYATVRELTLRQKEMLRARAGMNPLCALANEKDQVLSLIDRLEKEMAEAKSVVMSRPPRECPNRWRLAALLDSVQDMIEDIREDERGNAEMLVAIPA